MFEGKIVNSYEEFIDALNEAGFMLFCGDNHGFISLKGITNADEWHKVGDRDPWAWKDKCAERGDAAYARVLNGQNTFISKQWYPVFLAAFRPELPLDVRFEWGEVDRMTYDMYKLFLSQSVWSRHDLTSAMCISKQNKSKFDRSLINLQKEMQITCTGTVQRIGQNGNPIGWPSMEYTLVDAWASDEMKAETMQLDRLKARLSIVVKAKSIVPSLTEAEINFLFS